MTIDEYIDILLDGDDESILSLENGLSSAASYEYSERYGGFRVRLGDEAASMCKVREAPNCVLLLGVSHTFGKVMA